RPAAGDAEQGDQGGAETIAERDHGFLPVGERRNGITARRRRQRSARPPATDRPGRWTTDTSLVFGDRRPVQNRGQDFFPERAGRRIPFTSPAIAALSLL